MPLTWQSTKIGAGPTPIETDEGWLVLYHGVLTSCNGFVYSMGAALLDLDEPWKVLARGRDYLLSPQVLYEQVGDVPNVVFPCAALVDHGCRPHVDLLRRRRHRRVPRPRIRVRDPRVRARPVTGRRPRHDDTGHTTSTPFQLSFMSANYVAAELGYGAADEWGPFDDATNAAFEPLETFATRFDDLLATITDIGFDSIDLWFAHLNWRWATPDHVAIAREALAASRTFASSASRAASGRRPPTWTAACRLANDLDVDLIAGVGEVVHRDRDRAAAVLDAHGVRFGLENHPERTPAEVLAAIGDADVLGAAVDTGWWATQGYDPVAAIGELVGSTLPRAPEGRRGARHAHLVHARRGVRATSRDCVEKLLEHRLRRPVSIEHEPYDRDPTDECARMLDADP